MLLWVLAAGRQNCGRRVDNRRPHAPAGAPAPRPLPADTPVCGARARRVEVYVPGAVIPLAVGCRRLRPDRQLSTESGRQQATAQTPGLLARALDPQAQPLNEGWRGWRWGCAPACGNDAGNVEG
ncbi:hypothetical protein KCP78_10535 [Salmonella enterica subsp. enterica]|nr:hypothetical protein KCP78_10535 [Salmonella enterica subsp. enterica]